MVNSYYVLYTHIKMIQVVYDPKYSSSPQIQWFQYASNER